MKALFHLGQLVATPGALAALQESKQSPVVFLARHLQGDWGDVDQHDKRANDEAIKHELRLFSAYHTTNGVKLWVITEADRSLTTILLPDEY